MFQGASSPPTDARVVDFHAHYTPPELARQVSSGAEREVELRQGVPVYTHNRQLYDLDRRVEILDHAGIDAAYLSSAAGMTGSLDTCRRVNVALAEVSQRYPDRLYGLAHAPLFGDDRALEEMEHAFRDLGFRGTAIMSSVEGRWLDDPALGDFFSLVEDLGAFLFIHAPISPSMDGKAFDRYDLYRTVGREFELQLAVLRLVLGGVLDRHPRLTVIFAHLGGGIAAVWPRVRRYQEKSFWGVEDDPVHGQTARKPVDHYLKRIFFDTAGFFGDCAAVRAALVQVPPSQIVFGTDYPQQLRDAAQTKAFVQEVKALERDTGHDFLAKGAAVTTAAWNGRGAQEK